MRGDESALEMLSAKLAQLANGASFTVAEFTDEGVAVWAVSRDAHGTPEARRRRQFADVPEADPASLADFYTGQLAPVLGDRLAFVARSRADYPADLLDLLINARRVPVYECEAPLQNHIRSAITVSPLSAGYELVVLREEQDRRLTMDLMPLFPPDADSGYSTDEFTIRCAPTDEQGTVFAVMIRERAARATPASPSLWPVQIQSARVPPGQYTVRATLMRPGRVAFHGLPVKPSPDGRKWQEVVRTVPERLPYSHPAHLVCLLEVSGPEHLGHRIGWLEELINVAEAGGPLRVSLVTYGPHAVERGVVEEPATVVTWAAQSDLMVRKLNALKGHTPPKREYPRAAQVECALRAVVRMFAGRHPEKDGKPVLVTAGARPPHPDRVDVHSDIIPCRYKVSWQKMFSDLCRTLPDAKFGALCNAGALGNVWSCLGRDAIEDVEVVDVAGFAAKLGLLDPVRAVPFPLI